MGLRRGLFIVVAAISVACGAEGSEVVERLQVADASESVTTTNRATLATASTTSQIAAPEHQIPSGPLFLPAELPAGWELIWLELKDPSDRLATLGRSAWVAISRADGALGGGGLRATVVRSDDPSAVLSKALRMDGYEAMEIDGLVDANVSYRESSGIGSVDALLDESTAIILYGDVPRADLLNVASAVQVDGNLEGLHVEIELPGWVVEPLGEPRAAYFLGLRGAEGLLEVAVISDMPESSLDLGSSDLKRTLEGQVGYGYYAEEKNSSFASVAWWVPDVELRSSVGSEPGMQPELDLVVEIVDSFVEVDEATFRAALDGVLITFTPPEWVSPR